MSQSPQAFRPNWALLPLMGLFVATLWRLVDLQALGAMEAAEVEQLTDIYRDEIELPAPRGPILDRHGWVLAEDRMVMDLRIDYFRRDRALWKALEKEDLTHEEVVDRVDYLADAIGMPMEELWVALMENDSPSQMIRRGLGPAEERRVRAAMRSVPYSGLVLKPRYERVYPNGRILAHLIGLPPAVGVKAKEGEKPSPGSGIEGGMATRLTGVKGGREAIHVGRGYGVNPALGMREPIPGDSVQTTLDAALGDVAQRELERMMDSHEMIRNLAIAIDIKTGELLVAAGLPDYDPNDPTGSMEMVVDRRTGKNVLDGWVFPAKWRIEPGSTFKVLMAAYALDRGAIGSAQEFSNHGGHYWPPRRARGDDIGNATGVDDVPMTYRLGIVQSSNIVFAQVARAVGREGMAEMLDRLGFHADDYEVPGLKVKLQGRVAHPREAFMSKRSPDAMAYLIPDMGYGHGFEVSPFDHALALAAIANGGIRPNLKVLAAMDSTPGTRIFGEEAADLVKAAMHDQAMYRNRGKFLKRRDLMEMGGKSGTAEIYSGINQGRFTSLYAAFGPVEDPEVMVLVVAYGTQRNRSMGADHWGTKVCGEAASEILYRALLPRGLAAPDPQDPGTWIEASGPLDGRPEAASLKDGNR
ncbi:MAG: peptidoglycan D,D-transpeptidase FtsI family protein [Planctomycetota bacterium]